MAFSLLSRFGLLGQEGRWPATFLVRRAGPAVFIGTAIALATMSMVAPDHGAHIALGYALAAANVLLAVIFSLLPVSNGLAVFVAGCGLLSLYGSYQAVMASASWIKVWLALV